MLDFTRSAVGAICRDARAFTVLGVTCVEAGTTCVACKPWACSTSQMQA
jgi:hypothetical protein